MIFFVIFFNDSIRFEILVGRWIIVIISVVDEFHH